MKAVMLAAGEQVSCSSYDRSKDIRINLLGKTSVVGHKRRSSTAFPVVRT